MNKTYPSIFQKDIFFLRFYLNIVVYIIFYLRSAIVYQNLINYEY